MFSDGAGTIPALTTDTTDGFAVTVNVNLDGTMTLENFSTQTTTGKVATTPEPGSFQLVGMGLLGLLALRSLGGARHRFGGNGAPQNNHDCNGSVC